MTSELLLRGLGVLALLALASASWLLASRRRGVLRRTKSAAGDTLGELEQVSRRVDLTPGVRTTLVQFSSDVCTPCRRSARIWREVLDADTSFVEVDAADHLDLTRHFGIMTTPTTLMFDAAGHLTGRIHGAPTPARAHAALSATTGFTLVGQPSSLVGQP